MISLIIVEAVPKNVLTCVRIDVCVFGTLYEYLQVDTLNCLCAVGLMGIMVVNLI